MEHEYPFIMSFEDTYRKIARNNNGSLEWLRANALNHGISITHPKDDKIIFITTNKDCNDYLAFIKKYFKDLTLNFKIFSKLKFAFLDLPPYLKAVKNISKFEKKSIKNFQNYFAKKNIVDVASQEELLTKILTEKA